ncbi:MAG: endonuclease MutS2 [Heliobacteriaceae bacterium]|nr:endonuclease MutS2 [Heliobacteriaceae bacterium]MDD4587556.1 endonuclease MutS2 [Heliobacteriaceae bacterium]
MGLNERTLQKLEFDQIRERLAGLCASALGKERALSLGPVNRLWQVQERLAETTEAKEILRLRPAVPLGGIHDIRPVLRKAAVGGILEPAELLRVAETLQASRRLRGFLTGEAAKATPLLAALGEALGTYPAVEQAIARCITAEAVVADQASSTLLRVRRAIKALQNRMREKMEAMVRNPDVQRYLQDALVTMRGDRYVIPVRQEYRHQVPGLIHDQSASGATVFVEPLAVVEMNNEFKRLAAVEKEEVIKVLQALSALVAGDAGDMETSVEVLARLDFIFAKAKLSGAMDAGLPVVNNHGRLMIRSGRHPLLTGKVVPVTIELGKDFDLLVITGPNTGGKTVTLKTVGLLTVMAMAGLHVPAENGTELPLFEQIFVDIGDEQSIEQSLSTFSGHMTNIVRIINQAGPASLVLMDELGAGTDPAEGAALAQAILEHFRNEGVKVIATTHYSELKAFAFNQPRIENASVEFDAETLQPTYRLLIGRPGRSNAFEIAHRLGLAGSLVERARSFLTQEEKDVAALIDNLEASQVNAAQEKERAERLRQEATERLEKLEQRERAWQEKEADLLIRAREEAYQVVKEAREEADRIIKSLREAMTRIPEKELLVNAESERNRLRRFQTKISGERWKEIPAAGKPLKSVQIGQSVFIPRVNQKGSVLTLPNVQGEIQVQAGILKLTVNLGELRAAPAEVKTTGEAVYAAIASGKAREFSRELDFRGTTVEDALELVAKFLDDAYLAGVSPVHLIHGKGTGALRAGIRSYLQKHPLVKGFRGGEHGEGGTGVTVVELKS